MCNAGEDKQTSTAFILQMAQALPKLAVVRKDHESEGENALSSCF